MKRDDFDIAVIGGGIIGLSTARALAGERARVVVIDASAKTPSATHAAAGMLAPSFEESLGGDTLYQFSAASLAMWPDYAAALEEETGACVDLRREGILGVAFNEGEAEALVRQCTALQARGAAVEMITPIEARALEPALTSRLSAVMFARDDAQLDPRRLMKALTISLQKRNCAHRAGRATKITHNGRLWHIDTEDGDLIGAVRVVIATGALSDITGLPLPASAVFPVKGEALAVALEVRAAITRVIRGPGAYICPKSDGQLIIGATEIPGDQKLSVDEGAIARLRDGAARIAPETENFAELRRWAGLRPATADGAPIVGGAVNAPEGLFYALGHHRNGILLAPASAAALADLVMNRPGTAEIKAFGPARFN